MAYYYDTRIDAHHFYINTNEDLSCGTQQAYCLLLCTNEKDIENFTDKSAGLQ